MGWPVSDARGPLPPLLWDKLPHDAQRVLSGTPQRFLLELWYDDDGSTSLSPARLGEDLGHALLAAGGCNYLAALRIACEFAVMAERDRQKAGGV